jgi:hypothetical protein
MKLQPIRKSNGPMGSIRIICHGCGKPSQWNDASSQGWKYDPKVKAFNAFYCFPCQSKL